MPNASPLNASPRDPALSPFRSVDGEERCAEKHAAGKAALAQGKPALACQLFQQALASARSAEAEKNLGNALVQLGDLSAAESAFRRALAINPDHLAALNNLGILERQLGRLPSAERLLRRALLIAPNDSEVLTNLGVVRFESGDPGEAKKYHAEAVRLSPGDATAWLNLAAAEEATGALEGAANAYGRVMDLAPEFVSAAIKRASLLSKLGRFPEARTLAKNARPLVAGLADSLSDLGVVFLKCRQQSDARECFEQALTLEPEHLSALNNLALTLAEQGFLIEARTFAQRATELDPNTAENWVTLASNYQALGEIEQAVAYLARAVTLKPGAPLIRSNYLLGLNYLDSAEPASLLAAHRAYGDALPRSRQATPHNLPDGEKHLKIGYVSGDFREHSVAYFFEPILANHDRRRFSVHLFSTHPTEDAVTERLRRFGDTWHQCSQMSDVAMAGLIRQTGIDLLIDLSGHSAFNRLPVFALTPAPVQISYLGYPNTTGLAEMAYRITDAVAEPPEIGESWNSEQLLRLPDCFHCYRPADDTPFAATPPSLTGKPFTFGSFNALPKLSDSCCAAWGTILSRVPQSRLLLKTRGLAETEAREHLIDRLGKYGIQRDRIELSPPTADHAEHLQRYRDIDIALDSFPYNGTTTTCDALWMGVPVITFAGDRHASRVSASLLNAVRLPELVAGDAVDYAERAVALARDPERLAALHRGLRERMRGSPLMDEARFTLNLEACYRKAWGLWCEKALRPPERRV